MPARGGLGLQNATSFGGDPNALYLSGFSSGGHLGGCVVITEWEKQGLPRDILKGAVLGSGMYDLKPVRLSKRSSYVKFTDEMEQALSAMRHLDKVHTPLVLTIGLLETPEFQRQSRDFAAALHARPASRCSSSSPRATITSRWASRSAIPTGIMGRAALEMMKLDNALIEITGGCHADGQRNTITRRTLVAGAAAGTVALAADPASAQRCPATPPARTKGPAIWLDYDQHDMDEMYDQIGLRVQPEAHRSRAATPTTSIATRPSASPSASPMDRIRSRASTSGRPSGRTRRS